MLPSSLSVQQASLLCAAVALLLYCNSLSCGFCFDDLSAIKENHDLRPSTPWSNLLWNDFWGTPMHIEGSHKSYRPLCVVTFRLNYMLHGLEPMGYHLVNVLLHAVVCYLYVQLCAVVFTKVWPALIAGLLFAVHPIHTEAVSGVVGRAELLSSICFLLTLWAYWKAVSLTRQSSQTAGGGAVKWLVSSLCFCLFSVLCKEQGITAVAVCFTYDVFIYHQLTLPSAIKLLFKGGVEFRQLLFRGCALAGFTVTVILLRLQVMRTTLPVFTVHDNPAVAFPSPYRQLHWLYLTSVNLWLLLSPSFLCADWTMGTIPPISSLADPRHLSTLLSLLSVFILLTYALTSSSKRAKLVLFALALIILPFIPASNFLFPVGFVVAERVLYLPSMGYCLLTALGIWLVLQTKRWNTPLLFCLIACLGILSFKTFVRNQDWKNDDHLFQAAIRINPGNGKIYNNLGHAYEGRGNYSYAEKLFRMASQVQPDDIGAFINLGRTLKQMGHYRKAEKAYLHAIDLMPSGKSFRIAPGHINVYYNLANLVKLDTRRMQEAYQLYQQAISMKPDFVEAHMNKGDLLLQMNQTEDARQSFETALKHNPHYTDAHYNLATALLQLGRHRDAELSYRRALALDSSHIHSLLGLASLLQEGGHTQQALQMFQQVLTLDPTNIRAYFNLALLYLDQQDMQSSESMFLQALAIDPTYRSALYNIAVLYSHQQRVTEAIGHLQHLISIYPDHLNGAQLLGDCYMRLQQPKLAEKLYHHVLDRNPNHVAALHNLGVAKAESSHFEDAITLFRKVLTIEPSHSAARKHLEQAQLQTRTSKHANSTKHSKT